MLPASKTQRHTKITTKDETTQSARPMQFQPGGEAEFQFSSSQLWASFGYLWTNLGLLIPNKHHFEILWIYLSACRREGMLAVHSIVATEVVTSIPWGAGEKANEACEQIGLAPLWRNWLSNIGVSANGGTPKSSILIGFPYKPYKPSILGYPHGPWLWKIST